MRSQTLTIERASAELSELVHSLGPEDEIVITDNKEPIARITPTPRRNSESIFGAWKGKFEILDESDDIILEHFKDYLP